MINKSIASVLVFVVLSTSLSGCSAVKAYNEIMDNIKIGFWGSDAMVDHNNVSVQLVEGALSSADKDKERTKVKYKNGEEERNHDKLVKANGGISSSVDVEESEEYGDTTSTKENDKKATEAEEKDPQDILNKDFKKSDFVNEDSYSITSFIKYHYNEFKDYVEREKSSWSN